MSKQKIKTIKVESGVNPRFLEDTLTQDITPLESLFDLIDNAIDAARDHLLKTKPRLDDYGLPADYSEYAIHIRLDENSIRVSDNCLGIEEAVLSKKAFHVADPSEHAFGIGHYGLGLKRSLLKFGTEYAMATDTGEIAFTMRFSNKNFGGERAGKLTAEQYPTSGKRKTLFSVSNLKPTVRYELRDDAWFKNAIDQLSIRYAPYVSKGLKITVRSILHKSHIRVGGAIPSLRTNSKIPLKKIHENIEGVDVFIDAGIHQAHTFSEEQNHSLSNNRAITSEFGLYFICNDRVIVAASSSSEHGWKTNKWHSEYNGFVCLIRFVSKDPRKMPWNTAKTALKTDSTLFLKIKEELQPIADFYRGEIKRKYPAKKRSEDAKQEAKQANDSGQKAATEPRSSSTASAAAKIRTEEPAMNNAKFGFEELLHPTIHKHSFQHYLNGHYREAVLNSIVAVFDLIRERTGLDLDGANLSTEAFSLDRARLILSEIKSESGKNDQKGFMQIFSGAYLGIRNPKAHSLAHDLDKTKAAQYLVFASLLARRVQEAKIP
ncbi:MAG: TIGR02391 family protein [Sideroxyarcus sp.]|nr:TIGR02391 family protein [Sideroxyarcus sp.]